MRDQQARAGARPSSSARRVLRGRPPSRSELNSRRRGRPAVADAGRVPQCLCLSVSGAIPIPESIPLPACFALAEPIPLAERRPRRPLSQRLPPPRDAGSECHAGPEPLTDPCGDPA